MNVVGPILIVVAPLVIFAILAVATKAKRAGRERASAQALAQVAGRASQRLHLRRPELADLDFYLEMAADPLAAEANGWPEHEVAMVRQRFATPAVFDRLRRSEFVAIERSTSTAVSTVKFSPSPFEPGMARSIGIHVHPDHRNQGYGREVTAAAILLLQQTPEPVHVGTRTTNLGMQQIMRQLGFDPAPETRPYVAPNGTTYEAYWYQCGAETHEPCGLYVE